MAKLLGMAFGALLVCNGCASMKAVPYSFVENEINTASVTFVRGNPDVRFVSFEGGELPAPEDKTYWNPIFFPAGRPLSITVYADYKVETTYNQGLLVAFVSGAAAASVRVAQYVTFECPALESGNEYELRFRKEPGLPGRNYLVLRDINTRKDVFQQAFDSK